MNENVHANEAKSRSACRAREGLGLCYENLDLRADAVHEVNVDLVGAGVLDRLGEVHLAAVDVEATSFLDRVGDLGAGDRAEQSPILAGLVRQGEDGAAELSCVLGGLVAALLVRDAVEFLKALGLAQGTLGRRLCQVTVQSRKRSMT